MRALLAAGFILSAGLVLLQGVSEHWSRQGSRESLQKARRWEPWNPEHSANLARALQRPLRDGGLPEVILLYERTVRLSPRDAGYWSRLAQAYEWAGRTRDAESAYARAVKLAPQSPNLNWAAANFLLRTGNLRPAFAALQTAMESDPELRRPAFDLAWRATEDAGLIRQNLISPRLDLCLEYVNFLIDTQRPDDAGRMWKQMFDWGLRPEPQAAFHYLDSLIQKQSVELLATSWASLVPPPGGAAATGHPPENLIYNGDFESYPLNGGLDWRIVPVAGAGVALDSTVVLEGAHALRIRFMGEQNLAYAHVFQYVPVHPNTAYRFLAYTRAQDITTESGPRLQISDAYDPSRLLLETPDCVGTSPWSLRQLDFRTGPESSLITVRVTRRPSEKLENRIAGTFWLDHIQLRPLP